MCRSIDHISIVNPCYTGPLTQYQSVTWNFGDGTSQTINNPTSITANVPHTYSTAGIFNASMTLVDLNGCSATATHTVDVRNNIALPATVVNPLCNGGNNGTITVNPTGGFGNYNYNWSSGNTTTASNIGLTSGTYTVTANDGVCSASAQYTLNQPTPLTAVVTKSDASCGVSNGSVSIAVSGGTTPYQFVRWPPVSTTNTATGLGAGTYVADFRDANGCSALQQYRAVVNTLPCGISSSTSVVNVKCFGGNNGSATLNVTGGTGTPTVTWSPGGFTGFNPTGMSAGTYTYNYSDANPSHTFSGTVTITAPSSALQISLSTIGIGCAGQSNGQAIASVTGGGNPPFTYAWSRPLPNLPNVSNLASGPISVTVSDANTCSAIANGNITNASPIAVSFTNRIDSCFKSGNGQSIASVSGGSPPYIYSWNNLQNTATNSNLILGNYTLTITDAKNCVDSFITTIGGPTTPLNSTVSTTDILCFGDSTGVINISVTGGTPSYRYAWNYGTSTTNSATGLPASGSYSCTITDNFGCVILAGDTVYQPDSALVATLTHKDVSCFGANDGSLTLTVSGGTMPYNFLGNPVPTGTTTVPNLAPNTYAGNLTDNNNCSVALSQTITQPAVLTVSSKTENPVSCFGSNTGSANIAVSGGTRPYQYSWSPNVSTDSFANNLAAGTYIITIRDTNLCSIIDSVVITTPIALTRTIAKTNVLCYGNSTGSILITPSGGNGGYSYSWSPVLAGNNPTGLASGTYYLTTADSKNCSLLDTVTITQPDSALVAVLTHKDVSCFGANDGSLTLTVSGGTAPYNFLGNPVPSGTTTVPNLAPNTYAGNLTDNNNCSVALSQTITQPAVLTVSSKTENPVSCFGSNTGSANIAVSGGTRPYQYSWSPNVSTDSFANNLAAGTYIITIRDTNLCSIIDSFIITSPPRLTAQYVVTQIGCFGDSTGAITVTPSGGTPNYSYSWTPFTLSDSIVTGLSQGNYSLTIYDGRQCSIDTSFVITQPTAITATLTHKDVSCFGANDGSLTLTVSGGTTPYSFLGNPVPSGTTTVPNLAPNTYAGNLTDNNNCSVALSQTILEPTALTVVSKTAIDVACFGDNNGSASIQIGGGKQPYSYSWSPNVSTDSFATGLQNGTYVVTARDSNLCSITDSIIIRSQPQLFALVITSQVNCFGGSDGAIRVTPNGGSGSYNLTWNPASYTGDSLANLSAGTYTLTVTDDSLCVFDTSIVISQPSAALSFTQKDSTNVNCFGGNDGKIITKVSGGTASYTYTWMPNVSSSDSATNLTAGVYGLTVTDANNCSIATSIEITEPSSALAIDSITKTDVRCNGGNNGSATVFVSGGTTSYTYTWTPNAGAGSNVSNLTAGGYAILVTDNNGCTVTSSVSISEPSQITSTSTKTDVNCNGASDGTISINTTGGTPSVSGYRYTWNPNVSDSSTAINLSAGNYAITVSDSLLCTTTVAVTISEPASMILNGVVLNATCYLGTDGRITVTATGGASPYSYQISSDNGVTFTNNANNVFTNLTNQSYIVRVSDANSCSIDQTYVVTAPVAITAQFVTDSVSCFGDSDGSVRVINTIGGNGGYIYQLAAITNSSGVFTNLGSGTYPLVITDSKNCTVTFNPVVGEPEELLLDITANPSSAYQDSIVIKLGDIVQLNANTNYSNVVFQWTPSMGLSCDDCDDPLLATNYSIKYTVKATVIPVRKECIATKSLAVTVLKDYQLYIPNSFTPNGDGVNDMYEIFGNKAIIKFWSFDLYNRWGEKVFESNDINFQWDGRYKGVPVSQGVYVYHLNVVFIDNHKETDLRGSITILR
jgi:gliding motility-associated-like protein